MTLLLALLLVAMNPAEARARAALALAAAATGDTRSRPSVAQVTYTRPAAKQLPVGWHQHTCPRCRTTWQHGEDKFGNVDAHTCPKCGTLQWHPEPVQRIIQRPAFHQPTYQTCPGGRCPT